MYNVGNKLINKEQLLLLTVKETNAVLFINE